MEGHRVDQVSVGGFGGGGGGGGGGGSRGGVTEAGADGTQPAGDHLRGGQLQLQESVDLEIMAAHYCP